METFRYFFINHYPKNLPQYSWSKIFPAPKVLARILPICFAILTPLGMNARADDILSPEQVMQSASLGRSEFIQVCAEVERFAPILPANSELYPYIMLLDALDVLRISYDLDSFGTNPVKHMANVLTREALKWIRIDTDPWDLVDAYLRWAPDDTRQSAVGIQSYFLAAATTVEELIHWNEVSGNAVAVLEKSHAQPYVLSSYKDLQGLVIGKLLRAAAVTDEIAVSVIRGCHSVQGLTEIIQVLEQQVYAQTAPAELQGTIVRALETEAAISRMTVPTPGYLHSAIGQVLLEALQKQLFAGFNPSTEQVPALLTVLGGRQAVDLGALLGQLGVIGIKNSQVSFLWKLSTGLASVFTNMGLQRDLLDLQRFMGKLKLLMLAGSHGYEGRYSIRLGEISTFLTLANISGDEFIACLEIPVALSTSQMIISFSFMSIVYDVVNDQFIANRNSSMDSSTTTPSTADTLTFRLHNGQIKGSYLSIRGIEKFSGPLVQAFGHYSILPATAREDLSGVYVGQGDDSDSPKLRLDLNQLDSRASGRIFFDERDVDIQFTTGWVNPRNNAVYLTTRELESGRWIQVRGQIKNGRFTGEYVIGGKGKKYGTLHLQKQR